MRVNLVLRSRNAKTGPIPVTTTERASCWQGCPFFENGCYANYPYLSYHWNKVSDGTSSITWTALCTLIAKLPADTLWRHNQAGDLPGHGPAIDGPMLQQLVDANAGRCGDAGAQPAKRGFTYTHKPVLGEEPHAKVNRLLIENAVQNGFMINLSGDNPQHADWLAEMKIAPVVVVLPSEYQRRHSRSGWSETIGEWRTRIKGLPRHTPGGRRIAVCPATYSDTTCATCGACSRMRDAIIGFPAHGTGQEKANAVAIKH